MVSSIYFPSPKAHAHCREWNSRPLRRCPYTLLLSYHCFNYFSILFYSNYIHFRFIFSIRTFNIISSSSQFVILFTYHFQRIQIHYIGYIKFVSWWKLYYYRISTTWIDCPVYKIMYSIHHTCVSQAYKQQAQTFASILW